MNLSINPDCSETSYVQSCSRVVQFSNVLIGRLNKSENEKITQVSLKSLLGMQNFRGPILPLSGNLYGFFSSPRKSSMNKTDKEIEALIRFTATQVYKEKIERLTAPEVFFPFALRSESIQSPCLSISNVTLPVLFAKNILFRSPLPSEGNKIWNNYLSNPSFSQEDFFSIIKNQGYYYESNTLNCVLVAGMKKYGKKIGGVIYFQIVFNSEETTCRIDSLVINKKYKDQELETLLIGSAIQTALQEGCKNIIFATTPDDFSLNSVLDLSNENQIRLSLTHENLKKLSDRINTILNPMHPNGCILQENNNFSSPKEIKDVIDLCEDDSDVIMTEVIDLTDEIN